MSSYLAYEVRKSAGKFLRGSAELLDSLGRSLQVAREDSVVLQREVPLVPKTIPSAAQLSNFVAKTATVVGDVSLGKNTHVWYGAVVRGDMKPIKIGENTIISDRVMVHVTGATSGPGYPTTIGSNVFVKAGAIVHGCTLEDGCVVGEGAQVLDGAVVQKQAKVAPGSIVMRGKVVKAGQLWSGVPAVYVRDLTPDEIAAQAVAVAKEANLAILHVEESVKTPAEVHQDLEDYYDREVRSIFDPKILTDELASRFEGEVGYHQFPGRLFNSNMRLKTSS